MSVQVLISCFGSSITKVPEVLKTIPPDVGVLIVHQDPDGTHGRYDCLPSRDLLEVHTTRDRGLARSRNTALKLSSADIVLPTDDDVRFLPGAFTAIRAAFQSHPDGGVITFRATDSGERAYKSYRDRPFRHNLNTIRRVSSIEIALRRNVILSWGVSWDEDFGLNARYPGGLELAFMKNVLDAGVPAYYMPVTIVSHSGLSTGHRHTAESAFFRGAAYAKLFGSASGFLLAGFALKNCWRTGSVGQAIAYTRNLYRGAGDFLQRRAGR
jgi:glycosyltransferase involved in cell wall biosynthesis